MLKARRLALQVDSVGSVRTGQSAWVMALELADRRRATASRYPGMCFQAGIERGVWLELVWCQLSSVGMCSSDTFTCVHVASVCMLCKTHPLNLVHPTFFVQTSQLHTCLLFPSRSRVHVLPPPIHPNPAPSPLIPLHHRRSISPPKTDYPPAAPHAQKTPLQTESSARYPSAPSECRRRRRARRSQR